MKNIFELLKQAHHFRKTLRLCKKLSPESEEYKLGKFYKDEIEKLENSKVNEESINQLIQNAKDNMNHQQNSKEMTDMLSSVISFLTTLKHFVDTKSNKQD